MKKDMGGAANVLGLASMIMAAGLKVRLRVLIPAVENAISGDAFRPGDMLTSRKGLTVEIGNTDAEGRLILADALALADEEVPDLLIDMATLTGAARVALGPDLPPFYTDDDALAADLAGCRGRGRRPALAHAAVAPYDASSTRRSPTSTTPPTASPARSWRRCSCSASSRGRQPGRISTSSPGTRRPRRRPGAARRRRSARWTCFISNAMPAEDLPAGMSGCE